MSKELENHICEFCESSYSIRYETNTSSGYSKFCPFCGNEHTEKGDDKDDE